MQLGAGLGPSCGHAYPLQCLHGAASPYNGAAYHHAAYGAPPPYANGFGPAYYVMPEAGRAGDDGLGDALSAADLQGHDGAARSARQAGGRRALTEVEAARADRYSA